LRNRVESLKFGLRVLGLRFKIEGSGCRFRVGLGNGDKGLILRGQGPGFGLEAL
jgi:hypothetical protein